MTNERTHDSLAIRALVVSAIFLLAVFAISGVGLFTQRQETAHREPADIRCACVESVETSYDTLVEEASTKRRQVKIWIAPGTVGQLSAAQFRQGIIDGLKEISKVTNCDFVIHPRESGSQIRYRPATDEMMWQWFPQWRPGKSPQFPNGAVPLGAQKGNEVRFTTRNRWGSGTATLVGATIHETGHWARITYPENRNDRIHSLSKSDIMHAHLPVMKKSAADVRKFQGRLGVAR